MSKIDPVEARLLLNTGTPSNIYTVPTGKALVVSYFRWVFDTGTTALLEVRPTSTSIKHYFSNTYEFDGKGLIFDGGTTIEVAAPGATVANEVSVLLNGELIEEV